MPPIFVLPAISWRRATVIAVFSAGIKDAWDLRLQKILRCDGIAELHDAMSIPLVTCSHPPVPLHVLPVCVAFIPPVLRNDSPQC